MTGKRAVVIALLISILLVSLVDADVSLSDQQYYIDAYHFTPTEYLWLFLKSFVYRTPSGSRIRIPTYYDLLEAKLFDRFPLSSQREDWWCGPATVQSLVKYFNESSSLTQEEIVGRHNVNQYYGMNWGQMSVELKRAGLSVSKKFNTHEEVLWHLNQGHLVVVSSRPFYNKPLYHFETLIGIIQGGMFLADTASGKHVISVSVFYKEYSGLTAGAIAVWKE